MNNQSHGLSVKLKMLQHKKIYEIPTILGLRSPPSLSKRFNQMRQLYRSMTIY